ncbi:cytochrome b/b6 domain-containing protein [Bradyrhizobium sp. 14AA]
MRLKNTANRYGAMIIAVHWLTAALIILLLASGFRAAGASDAAAKATILRAHIPAAIALLALTVVRLVWRGFDRKPVPVGGSPRWQTRSAQAVHLAFYVIILGMIASGIGMMALSGAAPTIFGGGDALPDFWNYRPRLPHGIGARVLVALLILHVGAALYHQFVRRDGLLRRMWFGS